MVVTASQIRERSEQAIKDLRQTLDGTPVESPENSTRPKPTVLRTSRRSQQIDEWLLATEGGRLLTPLISTETELRTAAAKLDKKIDNDLKDKKGEAKEMFQEPEVKVTDKRAGAAKPSYANIPDEAAAAAKRLARIPSFFIPGL